MGPISSSLIGAVLTKHLIVAIAGALHLQLGLAAAYSCVPFVSMGQGHPAAWLCGSLTVSAIGLAVGKRSATAS